MESFKLFNILLECGKQVIPMYKLLLEATHSFFLYSIKTSLIVHIKKEWIEMTIFASNHKATLYFYFFSFWIFETGFLHVVLAVLELTV